MDSVSVNNNSRGDVSPAIDAELISVTQTLAKEEYVLFQLGKYVDCLKVLNQILEKKTDDPKKRNERPALSSGENAELNNRIKAVGNNKGNNVLANQASTINNAQGISSDDFDVSVDVHWLLGWTGMLDDLLLPLILIQPL